MKAPTGITDVHDPLTTKLVAPAPKVEGSKEREDVGDDDNIDIVLSNLILDSSVGSFMVDQVITSSIWKIKVIDTRLLEYQLVITDLIKGTE